MEKQRFNLRNDAKILETAASSSKMQIARKMDRTGKPKRNQN